MDVLFFMFISIELWNIPLRLSIEHEEIPFYIVPYFKEIGVVLLGLKIIFSFNTGIFIRGKLHYFIIIINIIIVYRYYYYVEIEDYAKFYKELFFH